MSENSKIEWTDHTHNLWWGCDEIGGDPACDECYARDLAENPFWWGKQTMFPVWGQDVGRRFFAEKHYAEPLNWNRAAEKKGAPQFVFCMSMGDWAEGRQDQRMFLDTYLYPVIESTPWLIWLLLTKRPQIAAKIVPERWQREGWPKNAWPGVTAVTQKWWDLRVPALMSIPATQHFVSAEPLMEAIRMGEHRPSWVICGGESGPKARPMHPDWARSLRDQCQAAGTAFFFKQWGEWTPGENVERNTGMVDTASWFDDRWVFDHEDLANNEGHIDDEPDLYRVGKKAAGRLLDGREWNERPGARR